MCWQYKAPTKTGTEMTLYTHTNVGVGEYLCQKSKAVQTNKDKRALFTSLCLFALSFSIINLQNMITYTWRFKN